VPVKVQVPKVRDRSGSGIKFHSALLPPYLRRTQQIEELLPWLYLKGISTGDFQEALTASLVKDAKGLSVGTIGRLKDRWRGLRIS
jgi:transposase-like protein